MDRKPIFIIGFTAIGKTTVGRALATALGRPFIDSDQYIEDRYSESISKMFATTGIDNFRKREREALIALSLRQDCIIATGGGMASHGDNIEIMLRHGIVIHLTAKTEVIIERLYSVKEGRAITEGMNRDEIEVYVKETLPKRLPYYNQVDHIVDVTKLDSPEDVDNAVQQILDLLTH